jgi:7,8-dihydro-6-hydroxymethylpterin-pyrophosphokinase
MRIPIALLAIAVGILGLSTFREAVQLRQQRQQIKELTYKLYAAPEHTYMEMQPVFDNRCFQIKTALQQRELIRKLDALPEADFKRTISDFEAVNAADRLLGTRGCDRN